MKHQKLELTVLYAEELISQENCLQAVKVLFQQQLGRSEQSWLCDSDRIYRSKLEMHRKQYDGLYGKIQTVFKFFSRFPQLIPSDIQLEQVLVHWFVMSDRNGLSKQILDCLVKIIVNYFYMFRFYFLGFFIFFAFLFFIE